MATGLGFGQGNAYIFHGQNKGTVLIPQGRVVAMFVSSGATHPPGLDGDAIVPIKLHDVVDDAKGDAGVALGIARHDIPVGSSGEIVVFGIVKAIADASVGSPPVVFTVNADGELIDAASGSHQAPCAISLEATVANQRTWFFVDFISGSFGGSLGNATSDHFWGQDYS